MFFFSSLQITGSYLLQWRVCWLKIIPQCKIESNRSYLFSIWSKTLKTMSRFRRKTLLGLRICKYDAKLWNRSIKKPRFMSIWSKLLLYNCSEQYITTLHNFYNKVGHIYRKKQNASNILYWSRYVILATSGVIVIWLIWRLSRFRN